MVMKRREFLGNAAACVVGVATAPLGVMAANPPEPLRLSILSYSFRGLLKAGMMDVFGYLDACKDRYGLHAADIWNGFLESTEESYLRKIKAALDERELVLADLCVDKAHVWEDNPAVRERNHENAKAHLQAASMLGARFMRVDAGGRGEVWTNEQFDHIVKRYQEYAQFAHDHGYKMGAENHWGTEGIWSNLKKLYDAVDHPAFGLSIHLGGWKGTAEEKVAWDREAAPFALHTHIAWNITQGNLEARLAPFYEAGYPGYYSVEHHSGKSEYRNVGIQLERVREVLEKLGATK